MANIFFIRTPMELLVAQQIIRQESLVDNIMLFGYIGNAIHFLDIYNLMCIDTLWKDKIEMSQIASWAVISRRHILRDCKNAYNNYIFINSVLKKYDIDTIYLGDVNNHSCQLAAMTFHKKGYKICFYEEGAGHYVLDSDLYGVSGGMLDKIYAVIIDLLYYIPIYGCNFGYVIYWKGFDLTDLPIDVRYSIVPFYHEPFDRLLTVQPMFSDRMKEFIQEETKQMETTNCILLLTSPYYCDGLNDDPQPYIKTIIDYVKTIDDGSFLHIKFHPREFETVKNIIISNLKELNIDFIIIGEILNVPVEYYLQYLHYSKIVTFFCSTELYNGYLFPTTKFESLMERYYINCKNKHLKNLGVMEKLIDSISEMKNSLICKA